MQKRDIMAVRIQPCKSQKGRFQRFLWPAISLYLNRLKSAKIGNFGRFELSTGLSTGLSTDFWLVIHRFLELSTSYPQGTVDNYELSTGRIYIKVNSHNCVYNSDNSCSGFSENSKYSDNFPKGNCQNIHDCRHN